MSTDVVTRLQLACQVCTSPGTPGPGPAARAWSGWVQNKTEVESVRFLGFVRENRDLVGGTHSNRALSIPWASPGYARHLSQ